MVSSAIFYQQFRVSLCQSTWHPWFDIAETCWNQGFESACRARTNQLRATTQPLAGSTNPAPTPVLPVFPLWKWTPTVTGTWMVRWLRWSHDLGGWDGWMIGIRLGQLWDLPSQKCLSFHVMSTIVVNYWTSFLGPIHGRQLRRLTWVKTTVLPGSRGTVRKTGGFPSKNRAISISWLLRGPGFFSPFSGNENCCRFYVNEWIWLEHRSRLQRWWPLELLLCFLWRGRSPRNDQETPRKGGSSILVPTCCWYPSANHPATFKNFGSFFGCCDSKKFWPFNWAGYPLVN